MVASRFEAGEWRSKFVIFFVACYLVGGVFATVILAFRKQKRERAHLQFALAIGYHCASSGRSQDFVSRRSRRECF